ncbi:hypothetical protein D3C76_1665520 [compost metagenome]
MVSCALATWVRLPSALSRQASAWVKIRLRPSRITRALNSSSLCKGLADISMVLKLLVRAYSSGPRIGSVASMLTTSSIE